jgi:hypothetical protein
VDVGAGAGGVLGLIGALDADVLTFAVAGLAEPRPDVLEVQAASRDAAATTARRRRFTGKP